MTEEKFLNCFDLHDRKDKFILLIVAGIKFGPIEELTFDTRCKSCHERFGDHYREVLDKIACPADYRNTINKINKKE